jgi:hypothetical protein
VAKSEYEVLASNGRLELDLLDRLEEKLGGKPSGPRVESASTVPTPKEPRKIRGGLFQAAANDEFEFLDGDSEWIHVGISGDSRGYLLRSSVDVPEKIAARLEWPATASAEEKFTGFRMEREETSTFP